jgi:hypothetical protein
VTASEPTASVPHEEADAPDHQPKAVDDLEANVALAVQISEEVINMPIQVRFLRSIRLFVAVATGVALLTVLGASSALAAETKTFTGQKNCGSAVTISPPNPGGYCLIMKASLKILMGAKVYYTHPDPTALAAGVLTSPVTLKATNGSTATGRCTFYFATGTGLCVYSSGTGRLAGFHARLSVGTVDATLGIYSLKGPYWFDRDHHGEGD